MECREQSVEGGERTEVVKFDFGPTKLERYLENRGTNRH
jgi:hypothetical protein